MHKPNTFTPAGAWYDGWETRRHNPAPFDWVVFRLGVHAGRVKGVEIDTGFFNGNQAPEIAVQGCYRPRPSVSTGHDEEALKAEEEEENEIVAGEGFKGWETILPRQPCGPACRQAWLVPSYTSTSSSTDQAPDQQPQNTHIRLLMYPDGGISRFRLYGTVVPPFSSDPMSTSTSKETIDLASLHNGGLVTSCSDQHFSPASNLLLPGRGVDMSDGWETKRSRAPGHTDYAIIKLGAAGTIERIVVDTAFFRGNFPREVQLFVAQGYEPLEADDRRWKSVGKQGKPVVCGADREHVVEGEGVSGLKFHVRWVKIVMVPDGGVKRLRVWGRRVVE